MWYNAAMDHTYYHLDEEDDEKKMKDKSCLYNLNLQVLALDGKINYLFGI